MHVHVPLLDEDVALAVDAVGLAVARLVHRDVRLVVQVAQVHAARVGRELGRLGVRRGHADVAGVGVDVEAGAGEAAVGHHVAGARRDGDLALETRRFGYWTKLAGVPTGSGDMKGALAPWHIAHL